MKNEAKVGALALVSFLVLLFGYNYLKGTETFGKNFTLYTEFTDVGTLAVGVPVKVNGFSVGMLSKMELLPSGRIKATLNIKKGFQIPRDAIVRIVQPSLMGVLELAITNVHPCDEGTCATHGDYLANSGTSSMLDEVIQTAQPVLDQIKGTISRADSSLFSSGNGGAQASINDIRQTLSHLNQITSNLDQLIAASTQSLTGTLQNVNDITANLRRNNEQITAILQNLSTVSQQLRDANLGTTVQSANQTLQTIDRTVADLNRTFAQVNALMADLQTTVQKASTGQGAVPMLLNDADFARQLRTTVEQLHLLSEDIRLHPERYRTILSGKKKPYESPR